MKKYYRAHFLGCELVTSFVLVGIVLWIIHHYYSLSLLSDNLTGVRDSLYGTLVTLSGGLLGFVIAGLSILLTSNYTGGMKSLRRSKHYKTIFTIFFSTSKYLGLLLIISLISLIFDRDTNPCIVLTLITFWSLIISGLRILRCIWVLESIVKIYIKQDQD